MTNLPNYYLSIYKAPSQVLNEIEKLMKNFLWGSSNEAKKMHWVSWEVVTTPKNKGGLGIVRLEDVNKALISKWAWRFKKNPNSSWSRIVEAIHGGRGNWTLLPVNKGLPGCWKSIASLVGKLKDEGVDVQKMVRGKVGDGSAIRFWSDMWYGETLLMHRWPGLYRLEKEKNCFIADRLKIRDGALSFISNWR